MLSLYPNFFKLGLTSNNLGYIIVRVGLQVSISVLVITSFVKTIPKELEEAACIDGAGQMRTFWQIVFPLMRPVNVTQLVLNTLFCWNDYNVAIVMLRTNDSKTLPLAQIIYFNENTAELNYAFAFFLMTMLPILILYFSMQRFIVRGIMSGAVKG
jgi:raffinose/stachyose/melibiose transport system permease protein